MKWLCIFNEIWSLSFRKIHRFGHPFFDTCQMKSDQHQTSADRNSLTLGRVNSRERPFKTHRRRQDLRRIEGHVESWLWHITFNEDPESFVISCSHVTTRRGAQYCPVLLLVVPVPAHYVGFCGFDRKTSEKVEPQPCVPVPERVSFTSRNLHFYNITGSLTGRPSFVQFYVKPG